MTDLLRKWAKAEPERCDFKGSFALIKLSGTEHSVLSTDLLASERAVVLAAVIEAIEAREGIWDYRLAWRMAPTGEHFGVVKVTREDGWEKSWSCYAGSPAAALLGAYLAALEAEAGQ